MTNPEQIVSSPADDSPRATQIAIAVVEHEDYFLIGQRPATSTLGGLWEFPGGKVNSGETIFAAAERETLEETGLNVVARSLLQKKSFSYDHGRVELHFVNCQFAKRTATQTESTAADSASLPQPVPPFRWVLRSELAEYAFPAGNAEVLALLQKNG